MRTGGGVHISPPPERSKHCEAMSLEGRAPAATVKHPLQHLSHKLSRTLLYSSRLAFAGTGYIQDKGHGMLDGEELREPPPRLADSIALSK